MLDHLDTGLSAVNCGSTRCLLSFCIIEDSLLLFLFFPNSQSFFYTNFSISSLLPSLIQLIQSLLMGCQNVARKCTMKCCWTSLVFSCKCVCLCVLRQYCKNRCCKCTHSVNEKMDPATLVNRLCHFLFGFPCVPSFFQLNFLGDGANRIRLCTGLFFFCVHPNSPSIGRLSFPFPLFLCNRRAANQLGLRSN